MSEKYRQINICELADWWGTHSLTALGSHPNSVNCLDSGFLIPKMKGLEYILKFISRSKILWLKLFIKEIYKVPVIWQSVQCTVLILFFFFCSRFLWLFIFKLWGRIIIISYIYSEKAEIHILEVSDVYIKLWHIVAIY